LTWRRGREVRVDAEFFIDRDGRKVRRSVRTMHSLTEDETDDLMYQASHREDPLWVEMDALMDQLFNQYPFRVRAPPEGAEVAPQGSTTPQPPMGKVT
jgi:hypothetical protein